MTTNIGYWKKLEANMPPIYQDFLIFEEKFLSKYILDGTSVLDIGCGNGRNLKALFKKTKKLVGVDISSEAVISSRQEFEQDASVSIFPGDGRSLFFKDNCFDNVISMMTFVNIKDEKVKFLQEMGRVVKPTGHVFLSVYNESALDARLQVYQKIAMNYEYLGEGKFKFGDVGKENTSEQFNRQELLDLFAEAGLKPVKIVKYSIGYLCMLKKN